MRPFLDQNLYEVLEVTPETPLREVERAYRIARSTYHPSSAATYSIYSEEESAAILRRVEEAHAVLSDARLRREYDARLRREGVGDRPRPLGGGPPDAAHGGFGAREIAPRGPVVHARERMSATLSESLPPPEVDLDELFEPEDGIYDGAVLRRIRMGRGVEIEEIAAMTKIADLTLQFIESNRYHELPTPVYLRGFLRAIATCLRLQPQRVADTYMERYHDRMQGSM